MKRRLEEVVIPYIPDDVFVWIAIQGGWNELSLTSKRMIRLLTRRDVLFHIIQEVKQRRVVYGWLCRPIRLSWLDVSLKLGEKRQLSRLFVGGLITGGDACQLLYGKEWKADIDVFVKKPVEERQKFGCYDVVGTPYEPHLALFNFDLSLVQFGYTDEEYFITPLALYTYREHDVIIIPDKKLVHYNIFHVGDFERQISFYIRNHDIMHNQKIPFHSCDECEALGGTGYMNTNIWRARIRKYIERFIDFTFCYIYQ